MISGIYVIRNIVNGKKYVGSAANIYDRWGLHIKTLELGTHHNRLLQRAWNKYFCENFAFTIVEYVDNKEDLLEREQYYMDITKCYDHRFGYNLLPKAGSCLGYKHSEETKAKRKGWKPTEHQRKAVSEANKKRIGVKYAVAGCPTARCKCIDCREYRNTQKQERRKRMKLVNPEKLKSNDKKWRGKGIADFVLLPVQIQVN
jgi:group I intron endonuclease